MPVQDYSSLSYYGAPQQQPASIFPGATPPNTFTGGEVPSTIAAPDVNTPTGVTEGPGGFNPYIQGIQALGGIGNLALGFKGLDLAQKQFKFSKDSFNVNLANQARLTNAQMEAQQRSRLSGTGTYDRNTAEGRAALEADLASYTAANRVSGTAI